MSALMKKHPTSNEIDFYTKQGSCHIRLPLHIANKYRVTDSKPKNKNSAREKIHIDIETVDANILFKDMDEQYTQAGSLLRGTRHRENLSQKEFAKKIKVTQSDLSKMENGKRPIGKMIAKRIEKEFDVDYRYFLG